MTAARALPALGLGQLLASIWVGLRSVPPAPGGADETDEALIARSVDGDRRAFDELYQRYVDTVWRWLTRLLGPDPEREDLTQQIFTEVFGRRDGFRGDARFRTFLYRVVVNTSIDQLHRRGRHPRALGPEVAEAICDLGGSPEQHAEERERVTHALGLLDRLKPKKRVAFILRVIEGLSLEEIGEIVGASGAAVAQRVRHAHKELQTMMARRKEEP